MNVGIRRIGIAMIVLFVALVAQLTYLQVGRSDQLANASGNPRKFFANIRRDRGPIETADGAVVALSIADQRRVQAPARLPERHRDAVRRRRRLPVDPERLGRRRERLRVRPRGPHVRPPAEQPRRRVRERAARRHRRADAVEAGPGHRRVRAAGQARAASSCSTCRPAACSPRTRTPPSTRTCSPRTTPRRRRPRTRSWRTRPTTRCSRARGASCIRRARRSRPSPRRSRSRTTSTSTRSSPSSTTSSCRRPTASRSTTSARRSAAARCSTASSCRATPRSRRSASTSARRSRPASRTSACRPRRRARTARASTRRSSRAPGPSPGTFQHNQPKFMQDAIGQNQVLVPPMEMALVAEAIANQGVDPAAARRRLRARPERHGRLAGRRAAVQAGDRSRDRGDTMTHLHARGRQRPARHRNRGADPGRAGRGQDRHRRDRAGREAARVVHRVRARRPPASTRSRCSSNTAAPTSAESHRRAGRRADREASAPDVADHAGARVAVRWATRQPVDRQIGFSPP